MFVEIVHLFLTGKFLVASKGDNLHTRSLSSGMYFLTLITALTAEGSLIEVRTSMMKDRT